MNRMKNDYIVMLRNMVLFGISSFASKIIAYLILPIYTGNISESDYGMLDLVTLIINLIIPIFSCCISDWLLRETTESPEKGRKTFSIAIIVLIVSTVLVSIFSIGAAFFIESKNILKYIVAGYFLIMCEQLFSYMLRANNKTTIVAIAGVISSVTTISCHLLCLNTISLSIDSYFICQFIGIIVSLIVEFFAGRLWKKIEIPSVEKKEIVSIARFCVPLMPNALFWWINSSVSQFIIVYYLGFAASGLYGAAAKIPSVLTIVASIFQQAWNLSLFQKRSSSKSRFEENVFAFFHIGLLLMGGAIILLAEKISLLLLKGAFYDAHIYVPVLITAFFFSTLSAFIGSFFTANKDTKPLFYTTTISALVSIVLNLILVKKFGLVGATLSTMISAAINYFLRVYLIIRKKYICVSSSKLLFICELMLVLLSISYFFDNNFLIRSFLVLVMLIGVLVFLRSFLKRRLIHNILNIILRK